MEINNECAKEEIIEFLRFRSSALEHTVLKSEVSREERKIVVGIFGSWNNAVLKAGLEPPDSHEQTQIRITQLKSSKTSEDEKNTIWKRPPEKKEKK